MNRSTALLGCIVLLSVIVRCWQIGESFWLDELHTSWAVSGSVSEVAERAALGNQSPLYFWLAWFFAPLPLPPEVALRLPSLLAGCALPIAICWLAKKLPTTEEKSSDDTVPLLAAALVAIDPLAIFYSQEARPYALLLLAAVIHFGLLLRILERSAIWPRVGWVVTGALLVHLHYTGALVLVAECVSLAILVILSARKSDEQQTCSDQNVAMCCSCWIDLGALAVLILPAIPGVLAVAARRENWNQMVDPQEAIEILRMFPWTPAVVVLLVLNYWRPVASQRSLILLAGWLLVPLCLAWVCTQTHLAALFFKRYLIAAWPASILAAALSVRLGVNSAARAAVAVAVLAISLANAGLVQNWLQDGRLLRDRNEDWRSAVHELRSNLAKSNSGNPPTVLLRNGLIESDELPSNNDPRFIEYCAYPVNGAYAVPTDVHVFPLTKTNSGEYLLPTAKAQLQSSQVTSFWLLGRGLPAAREQTLQGLQTLIEGEQIWLPQPPQTFGNVYLQQVIIRER